MFSATALLTTLPTGASRLRVDIPHRNPARHVHTAIQFHTSEMSTDDAIWNCVQSLAHYLNFTQHAKIPTPTPFVLTQIPVADVSPLIPRFDTPMQAFSVTLPPDR